MKKQFIFSVIVQVLLVSISFSADIYVNPGESIQAAIDAAVYGDTVHVAAGTYVEAITLKNGVAVIGVDRNTTIIDGNDFTAVRSDNCDTNTVLEGFTITDGFGTFIDNVPVGGGMLNMSSHPTVSNCIFNNNGASQGGGMYNEQSNPTVTDCTFAGNYGSGIYNEESNPVISACFFNQNNGRYGGGIRNINSSLVIEDCVFDGNISPFRGGGVYNQGSSGSIINCIFRENESEGSDDFGGGGGIYNEQSNLIISGCSFTNNSASCDGGGMYNNESNPAVSDCTFSSNQAYYGCGMYNWDSSPNVSNCSFLENKPLDLSCSGAGMYSVRYSQPIVTDCTFRANKASNGGGMYNDFWSTPSGYGCAIVNGCIFENNTARVDGGGMYNDGYAIDVSPTVYVSNSIFRGNQANPENPASYKGSGGGIYNAVQLTLTNCIFEENTAHLDGGGISNQSGLSISGCVFTENSTYGWGGGIYNAGGITAANSSFLCNHSGSEGGGIYNIYVRLTATNCLFVGNSSDYGGGMYNHLCQEVTCSNCTICYNTAEDGASAIYNYISDTTITNSILWGNAVSDIYEWPSSPNVSIQYSDVEGGWPWGVSVGNIDEDPLFVDPNGVDGIAGTADDDLHLLPWSPCIDAGDPSGDYSGQTDMDGQDRVLYDTVDMGVDEVFPIAGDIDKDGDVDINDFSYFTAHWLKGK